MFWPATLHPVTAFFTYRPSWASRAELTALTRLAAPVVLSQFATNALALISTAVVGRLGPAALAAAGYANATYYLLFMMLLGMMLAVGPRSGAASGRGDPHGVTLALRAGLWLAGGLAALGTPLVWLVAALLPQLAPPDIHAMDAAHYLRVYSLSMLPALVLTALRGVLESTGHAQQVTKVALTGVLATLLLSPALALGLGGLPQLGITGAAGASVLTSWLMVALLLPFTLRRVSGHVSGPEIGHELRALLSLGWPIGLTLGAESGMFGVTALLMARFGSDALAAHNVALQVITALFMIPLGLSTATGIRVAQAAGADNMAGVRRAGFTGISLAVAVMLCFAALELSVPKLVIGIFVDVADPKNALLVKTATSMLAIAALFQTVDGIQVTSNAALRGLQDTRVPLLISLSAYWLVGLGIGSLLAFGLGFGPRGLWYGLLMGLATAAALLLWRFARRSRHNLA